ncbi:MAG: adenylyl-sulfate kinase, partial [Myxococcota bacterium]|nr:adenylyl-sulfate kinase [Myxococcota bacterium]
MSSPESNNLTWHEGQVGAEQREALLGHRAACLWLTGLSGSGKSTLARALESALVARGCAAYVL